MEKTIKYNRFNLKGDSKTLLLMSTFITEVETNYQSKNIRLDEDKKKMALEVANRINNELKDLMGIVVATEFELTKIDSSYSVVVTLTDGTDFEVQCKYGMIHNII